MISGPSIDDQRAIRTVPPLPQQLQNGMQAQVQASQAVPELADSDEERDPNDFAPIPATAPLEHGGTYGDDDSDYGQSDSD